MPRLPRLIPATVIIVVLILFASFLVAQSR